MKSGIIYYVLKTPLFTIKSFLLTFFKPEMQDKKEELELKTAELQFKRDYLQFLVDSMRTCTEASPNSVLDEETSLYFKNKILDLAMDASTSELPRITVRSVAAEIGVSLADEDVSIIDKEAMKRLAKRE